MRYWMPIDGKPKQLTLQASEVYGDPSAQPGFIGEVKSGNPSAPFYRYSCGTSAPHAVVVTTEDTATLPRFRPVSSPGGRSRLLYAYGAAPQDETGEAGEKAKPPAPPPQPPNKPKSGKKAGR
jgi:hypothetical protein